MNVLAIDCSSDILSLCLQEEQKIFSLDRKEGLRHSENLMPGIDWLFQQASMEKQNLDLVVCAIGPGSFTGLRIALATAKALATGCSAALCGIPTLDAYAALYRDYPGLVIPVIDAKKKRFYTAVYKEGKAISDFLDISEEDLLQRFSKEESLLFTGPDAGLLTHLPGNSRCDLSLLKSIGPVLLEMGLKKYKLQGEDTLDIGPEYIRKSEAEIAAGM